MNRLILATLTLATVALADVNSGGSSSSATGSPQSSQSQYAEPRESSNWAPASSFADTSASSFYSQPVTYSTGHSYSSDPWPYEQTSGYVSQQSSFLGNDLISTGLNIVLGLFAFSLILQIVSRVINSNFFDDIFDARSLKSDDLVYYTNMAVNAFKKFEEMNQVPK